MGLETEREKIHKVNSRSQAIQHLCRQNSFLKESETLHPSIILTVIVSLRLEDIVSIVIDDMFLALRTVFLRALGNLMNAVCYFSSHAVCFLSDFLLQHFDYFCFEASSSKLLFGAGICKEIKVWFVILQSDSGIRALALSPLLISCLPCYMKLCSKCPGFHL